MGVNNHGYSDGGFMDALALAGGLMFYLSGYSGDVSMRVMGGVLMAPDVWKYSSMFGEKFYEECRKFHKDYRARSVGRSLEGKYLTGKCDCSSQ